MDWSKKIEELEKFLNMKSSDIARKIDIDARYIYEIKNGKSKNPSPKFLQSLVDSLGINPDWFFMDEKPVLLSDRQKILAPYKSSKGIPFYNIDIAAHISEMFETEVTPSFFVDFEPFNDCTAYVLSYGDSMFPLIQSGDILAIKKLSNLDVLLWGEAHVVIAGPEANNLRTVKLIFPCDDPSRMILRASNPNFRGDTIIDKSAILSIYIVKGIITRKQW